MNAAIALRLGYQVEKRRTRAGERFFCAPLGTPPNVSYGRPFATELEALGEVERRVAFVLGQRLGREVSGEELREHLEAIAA